MHLNGTAPAAQRSEVVLRPQPRPGALVRLVCIPYAGGSSVIYHPWLRLLPAAIELNALQLAGRGHRVGQPAHQRLDSLVRELTQAVAPCLDRPFVLFGHSLGALVSFELARTLRRCFCLTPVLLAVSGYRAPHLAPRRPPIHQLPQQRFWDEIRRLHGTPAEVLADPQLTTLVEPALRADLAVVETYEHEREVPLECPIAAFGGREDAEVPVEDLEAWTEHTDAGFSLSTFEGGHFFLHSEQRGVVRELLGALSPLLNVPLRAEQMEVVR
ncbi:MAG TPA: alpha/beta fold hydrolase [Candidatus Eisenbacteria bacterium]|nr:alpha/beta fold hydrolase [Candidatus Eisenbacteria bacterium]